MNFRPQSSQRAETVWTDPGMKKKCGISVRELISTLRKKRGGGGRTQAGNEWSNIVPKFVASKEKSSTTLNELGHSESEDQKRGLQVYSRT